MRPTREQITLLAPDRASATAALGVADPNNWSGAGCDDEAVWGMYLSSSAEPYEVAVDFTPGHGSPAFRCKCPSRKLPCKHALGLLLLHADHALQRSRRLPFAAEWLRQRAAQFGDGESAGQADADADGEASSAVRPTTVGGVRPPREPLEPPSKRAIDRSERMRAGLRELDRWLADRVRHGLADPQLAEPATWQQLGQRLIDAQCGALANRVGRISGRIGESSSWREHIFEEIAILHALAVGAQRTGHLDSDLADGVHVATGLTLAKDDVLAGVPSTATWLVAGESRVREDRITVQRTWLCSQQQPTTWAMLLSFGVFGQDVQHEHEIGSLLHGDVHWYPAGAPLRALVGQVDVVAESSSPSVAVSTTTLADGLAAAGWAIGREPWLERYPMLVNVIPTRRYEGVWALSDETGSVALDPSFTRLAPLVCVAGGRPVAIMGEYSAAGFLPLTVWDQGFAVML